MSLIYGLKISVEPKTPKKTWSDKNNATRKLVKPIRHKTRKLNKINNCLAFMNVFMIIYFVTFCPCHEYLKRKSSKKNIYVPVNCATLVQIQTPKYNHNINNF